MTAHDPTPRVGERALAPDLARGLMLLLIAVANVPWLLYGAPRATVSAHRVDATGADAVWQSIAILGIDGRSYPLFAFLFGYGIWQLYTRQHAAGVDEKAARRLLQRRHVWMLVFGFVHAALLWYGDIVGAYGLIGLIIVWLFLRRTDKTLRIWAIVLTSVLAFLGVLSLVMGMIIPPEWASMSGFEVPNLAAITPYADSILPRILFWLPATVGQGVVGLIVPVSILVAIVCARHRVLESPARHRPLLARAAIIGIAVGWLGGVPSLLVQAGAWDIPDWSTSGIHSVTGLFGGLGYAAVFALLAARISATGTSGGIVRGLTSLGKRSLTGYLLQSVIMAPLLCAWGLGLGGMLTEWQAALVAVATWLVTIAIAVALDRAGKRGPAEWLLRTLAYRGKASAATPVTTP